MGHHDYRWEEGQGRSIWPIAAGEAIYDNAFLGRNGNLARPYQPGDDKLGFAFRSVNVETHDTDNEVDLKSEGRVRLPVTGVVDDATHYLAAVWATDYETFTVTDPVNGDTPFGTIKKVESAGYAIVAFNLVLG